MGLLDYYRQFEGLSEQEVNSELRRRAEERRRLALERVEPLDLSETTWPELPHPYVVNAVTYAARRGLNANGDPRATGLRRELAGLHGIVPERIAVGHGASGLLAAAVRELMEPGDELVTPWPSYPLTPLAARRAGGSAVPVRTGSDPDALLAAVTGRTRIVAVCNPNDPTGSHLPAAGLRSLLERLPERVVVLLDEALIDFVDAEPADASLELLEDHPRLLIVRSFSKAWGLAGLRCGYALGGPGAEDLLERIAPPLGVGDLTQAGALEALRTCSHLLDERRAAVAAERSRLLGALAGLPIDAAPTHANLLWLSAPGIDGAELAMRLRRAGVIVRSGGSFGSPAHVRAAIHPGCTDRLAAALTGALAPR